MFAQQAALGAHTYILEDGPCLPTESGPHADEGGEILSGLYAQSCTRIEDSRLRGRSGMAGSLVTGSGTGSTAYGSVMLERRSYQLKIFRIAVYYLKTFQNSYPSQNCCVGGGAREASVLPTITEKEILAIVMDWWGMELELKTPFSTLLKSQSFINVKQKSQQLQPAEDTKISVMIRLGPDGKEEIKINPDSYGIVDHMRLHAEVDLDPISPPFERNTVS
jgi:hypothetical protein